MKIVSSAKVVTQLQLNGNFKDVKQSKSFLPFLVHLSCLYDLGVFKHETHSN